MIRHILIFVIASLFCTGANLYVCNSPRTQPSGGACDYTSAQIQAALDAAADGDTLYLQEGITFKDPIFRKGHTIPVTVTSWKSDWLPCTNCRITPSYFSLLPIISPSIIGSPALQGQLDGTGNPPSGWNFVGIAFWAGTGGRGASAGFYYTLIHTGGQIVDSNPFDGVSKTASTSGVSATVTVTGYAVSNYDIGRTMRIGGYGGATGANFIAGDYRIISVNTGANTWTFDRVCTSGVGSGMTGFYGWYITGPTNEPNNITFDRIYTRDDYDDATTWQNSVRINGHNITLKNSFIWPVYCQGVECHGASIATASNAAPITFTNNFISASTIPIFAGGVDSDYVDGSRAAVVARYNYFFRPLKWWSSVNNPQRSYYVANGSKNPCTKNLGEWKSAYSALMEFNVHENVWEDNFCQGQYFGFTNSVRQLSYDAVGRGVNLVTTAAHLIQSVGSDRLASRPRAGSHWDDNMRSGDSKCCSECRDPRLPGDYCVEPVDKNRHGRYAVHPYAKQRSLAQRPRALSGLEPDAIQRGLQKHLNRSLSTDAGSIYRNHRCKWWNQLWPYQRLDSREQPVGQYDSRYYPGLRNVVHPERGGHDNEFESSAVRMFSSFAQHVSVCRSCQQGYLP